jgi:hypothetical protein
MASDPFVQLKCPLCGWRRPVKRRGIKAALQGKTLDCIKPDFTFGKTKLKSHQVLQVCVSHGCPKGRHKNGRKKKRGVETIGGKTLAQLAANPAYSHIVMSIYNQAKAITDIIERVNGDGRDDSADEE